MKMLAGAVLGSVLAIVPSMAFAGSVVVTTPSGNTNITLTNGAASHVTSQYSAQINDVFAAPGQHITVTPNGTHLSQGNGKTATITVVGN